MEQDNLQEANLTVREWVGQHRHIYQEFLKQVDAIGKGDLSLMERMMQLLNECMPQSARDFYGYIFGYLTDPESAQADSVSFSQYDQLAAQCIMNNALIKMDLTTGQITQVIKPENEGIIIRTDDFEDGLQGMSRSMKCLLNDQITQMMLVCGHVDLLPTGYDALKHLALLVAKTVYVYSILFVPDFLKELHQKVINGKESLPYCIHYFICFDNGLQRLAELFCRQMVTENSSTFSNEMLRLCLNTFVQQGLSSGTETKADWLHFADKIEDEDVWSLIHLIVSKSKTSGGRHSDDRTIDELLIGDTEHLKDEIVNFIHENPAPSRLAYLFFSLWESGHIEKCSYITFHRAISRFYSQPIGGPDVPQQKFNEILANPHILDNRAKKWQTAKATIDHWEMVFSRIA